MFESVYVCSLLLGADVQTTSFLYCPPPVDLDSTISSHTHITRITRIEPGSYQRLFALALVSVLVCLAEIRPRDEQALHGHRCHLHLVLAFFCDGPDGQPVHMAFASERMSKLFHPLFVFFISLGFHPFGF